MHSRLWQLARKLRYTRHLFNGCAEQPSSAAKVVLALALVPCAVTPLSLPVGFLRLSEMSFCALGTRQCPRLALLAVQQFKGAMCIQPGVFELE